MRRRRPAKPGRRPATRPAATHATRRRSHDVRQEIDAVCAAMRGETRWPSPCTRTPTPTRSARRSACSTCSGSSACRRRSTSLPTRACRTPTSSFRRTLIVTGPPPAARDAVRARRGPPPAWRCTLGRAARPIVNIDHHHDNTRFGDLNLGRRRGQQHVRDRLRARPRALGLRALAARGHGTVRRHLLRHRAFPARAARGRDLRLRGSPGRAAAPTRAGLPPALRAPLAWPRCGCGRGRRARAARRRPRAAHHADAPTSPPPAPATTTPRASSTPCAPCAASSRRPRAGAASAAACA